MGRIELNNILYEHRTRVFFFLLLLLSTLLFFFFSWHYVRQLLKNGITVVQVIYRTDER